MFSVMRSPFRWTYIKSCFASPGTEAPLAGWQRTDLVVVQIDPERRHFGLHLVEVKARASLPDSVPTELADHISEQLDNSLEVIRDRLFGANLTDRRNSLVAALHVRRLTQVMTRYLDRALRFGYLDADLGGRIRTFLTTLDRSYTIVFRKQALLFELEGEGGPGERYTRGRTQPDRPVRDHLAARTVGNPARDSSRCTTSPEHLETVLGGRGEGPPDVTVEPVDTPV